MSFMELDDKKLVTQKEMSSWLDMTLQKDDTKIEYCRMMRYHQHGRANTLRQAVRGIKSHDKWQMGGRK